MLALDTSTQILGISLYDGAQVLSENVWSSPDHHTIQLTPAIQSMVKKCGLRISEIRAVAVALGPGSFTGLRIGLAAGKALAYAARIPVLGIPSLEALVYAQGPEDEPVISVLKAGRKRLAFATYSWLNGKPSLQSDLQTIEFEELVAEINYPALWCGEFNRKQREELAEQPQARLATPAMSLRRPSFIAEIAWQHWQEGEIRDPATIAPVYLHFQNPQPA